LSVALSVAASRADGRWRARPAHAALAAILVLSGLLEFVRLGQNGFANVYYSAAVKSMLRSWHNFFFLSADPQGLISADKPPLGLWLQAVSAKLFGFTSLSLLVPEAICAVLAVALMYRIVAPRFGNVAGLVSAFALAVFPSFVAVSRDNGVDPLLILLTLAACGAALAAVDSGRLRTIVWCAVLVGLAFNTKALAALLCVPGIAVAYVVCAPGSPWQRVRRLTAAGAVFLVVALSWIAIVQVTPPSQRPFIGDTSSNSEFQLVLGYNGFGRVGGQQGGPGKSTNNYLTYAQTRPLVARRVNSTRLTLAHRHSRVAHHPPPRKPAHRHARVTHRTPRRKPAHRHSRVAHRTPRRKPAHRHARVAHRTPRRKPAPRTVGHTRHRLAKPVPFGGPRGPLRIVGAALGGQAGWLVPFALIGMLALGLALRGRGDRRTAALFVLGGWFLIELATLDFSAGIVHPYYASALGPGLAAMVGAGGVAIATVVRNRGSGTALGGFLLALLAVAATVAVQLVVIAREGDPLWWRIPLVVLCLAALIAIPLARGRAGWAVAVAVGALLAAPMAYSFSVWLAPVNGTFPVAGPYSNPGRGRYGLSRTNLRADRSLIHYLRTHGATRPYALLTESSDQVDPLILLGLAGAAAGGYNTTDPALSGPRLAALVAAHKARYVMIGGPFARRGGNDALSAARLVCPEIPGVIWSAGASNGKGSFLVDCAGKARELRHPYTSARAFIRAHHVHYRL
jgi:4-amino-4-deoxy-L-arabinose transferase-like glycosyltransferase